MSFHTCKDISAQAKFVLQLADTQLILAQQNSAWTGHGPILEQDIALSNIALDQIGAARMLYQYAASLLGGDWDEDRLAFLRDGQDYYNLLLVERPNGHWGTTVLRQFFMSAWLFPFFQGLKSSSDSMLSAIAEKSLKEVTYHYKWSKEWVVRLGDGTAESKEKMQSALEEIWPYTGECEVLVDYEEEIRSAGVLGSMNWEDIVSAYRGYVEQVLTAATLVMPPQQLKHQKGGKLGKHTERLGYILAEMQYLQRTYPNSVW